MERARLAAALCRRKHIDLQISVRDPESPHPMVRKVCRFKHIEMFPWAPAWRKWNALVHNTRLLDSKATAVATRRVDPSLGSLNGSLYILHLRSEVIPAFRASSCETPSRPVRCFEPGGDAFGGLAWPT